MKINSLHKFIRHTPLTNTISEIVINRGSISPNIGTILSTEDERFYLASGVQEVWLRLLYRPENITPLASKKPNSAFVLRANQETIYPNISVIDPENAVFIVRDIGIALCFSYFSSYITHKVAQLFYITDEAISLDWIKQNQNTVIDNKINNNLMIDPNKMYYVIGNSKHLASTKLYLTNKSIADDHIIGITDYY